MILILRHPAALPLLLLLGACSHSTLAPPSLAPRAAEKVDPRVPVERALTERPMSGGVQERLASLIVQARSGDVAYRAALGPAQRAVAAAGPARSESWISAQVAMSALEAARSPTTAALGAIDAIAGEAVAAKGAIGASDLAAVQSAGAEAGAIDAEQRATIASLNARIAR
jgi:hypothetical protein